jgi:regulator of sigma E protease
LAIVIFAGIFTIYGKHSTAPRIDLVQPDTPAATAGLKPGDLVLSIDGQKIETFTDLQRTVEVSAGRPLQFVVERGGVPVTLTATPALVRNKDRFGNKTCHALLGVQRSAKPEDIRTETFNPVTALGEGTVETWSIVARTFSYIGGLFMGRECADQLGGPIRIAQISGQVATLGFIPIINLAAMLSVSIGLLNLFPVPLLDGGHLLFYAIEAVRGRPLSERAQEIGFRIGLALVVMLMIFATFNDILHLAAS